VGNSEVMIFIQALVDVQLTSQSSEYLKYYPTTPEREERMKY
jgi:hypothetical protein